MKLKREYWNRCDACGKFIAYADFDDGAVRVLMTPHPPLPADAEIYQTLCKKCAKERKKCDEQR